MATSVRHAATERVPAPMAPKVKPAAQGPRRRVRRMVRQLPIHIFLIPLCFFWIYPFLWMLAASFKTQQEMFLSGGSLVPDNVIVENYVRAWERANFGQYTLNTFVVTIATVIIVVLVASMAGYALGRGRMPGKRIVVGVLAATMFLPHGFTILPIFVLINEIGLNNSLAGVIVVLAGSGNVIAILLFMGYFMAIPRELEESAIMDGAGHLRIYAQIMLPLAKPVIGTVAIFNFISAWNAFLVPLVFTLTRPDLRTLGVGIYSFFGEFSTDWAGLAAGSVITIVPVLIVFLWLQRYFIEGLAGSIKG